MDSAREASDVRREEAPEARLGGLLPGSRLTQCSHREELVEPNPNKTTRKVHKNRHRLVEDDCATGYKALVCATGRV